MNASKFGAEYALSDDMAEFPAGHTGGAFEVPYPRSCCCSSGDADLLEAARTMREALQEVWLVMDALGAYQSDDDRLSILHSPKFSSAAYRVRTAMIKTQRVAI